MRIIKPKTKKDFIKAKKFIADIIKDDFGFEINSDWHWDVMNLKETYISSGSIIYVLEEGDDIVGTIAGRPYDRQYKIFKDRYNSENTISLWRHYIKRDFRGKGYGSMLLSEIENFAIKSGYKYIYLHTQKTIKNSLEYWLSKKYVITNDVGDEFQTVHLEKMLQ